METINSRLASILLIEKRLTAYEIGKNIGVSTQSVDNWLKGKKGKYVMPGADAVAKICEAYEINTEYALNGIGERYTNKIAQNKSKSALFDNPPKTNELQEEIDSLHKKVTEITGELISVQKKYTALLEKQMIENEKPEKHEKPAHKKVKTIAKALKMR